MGEISIPQERVVRLTDAEKFVDVVRQLKKCGVEIVGSERAMVNIDFRDRYCYLSFRFRDGSSVSIDRMLGVVDF